MLKKSKLASGNGSRSPTPIDQLPTRAFLCLPQHAEAGIKPDHRPGRTDDVTGALRHQSRSACDIQHLHPGSESGFLQCLRRRYRDAEAKTGRLVDISILIRRAVEEFIEKALSGLAVATIVPVERRMRSKRDEGKLSD